MQLASKIKQAINSADRNKIRTVYFEVFGKEIKQDCNNCYNEAIYRLIKFTKKTAMQSKGKYKFKDEYKYKKMTVNVNGQRVLVTAETLTDSLAETLIGIGRGNLLEENKTFIEPVEEKKTQDLEPTLSTSIEVLNDGNESDGNVNESESPTSESQPLTVKKKRGRKPKVVS